MKKFLLIFSIIFASFLVQGASASTEQIENYNVDIEILSDSSLWVTETISYDFGNNRKHGIFRDIPILQKDYSENQFKLSNIVVVDEKGDIYKTKLSKSFDNINIKIGDADKYVTGLKTYIITYKVEGGFLFEDNTDNLFWNAIGTEWKVPVLKNNINIFFPEDLDEAQFQDKCYLGVRGSTIECPGAYYVGGSGKKIRQIVFKTNKLSINQGVTVNLHFEKGIIDEPPPPNSIIVWLKRFGFFFPPLITFIFMFYWWYSRGRDPKGRGNIIVQYEPPKDMMPAEMGTLLDESVDKHDFSAEIIHLAIHGYIKIRRIDKKSFFSKKDDYMLEKLKDGADLTRDYQRELLEKLFSKPTVIDASSGVEVSPEAIAVMRISDLNKDKNSYKWVKKINNKIYKSLTDKAYFDQDPRKVKAKYSLGFIVISVIFIILQARFSNSSVLNFEQVSSIMWGAAIATSGLIVVVFGMAMPKRTIKGVLAKEHILGLKEYINVAEKDRIKFHNDPAKDPKTFEKLLPYAMVFKLEKKWAKNFEDIYSKEPNWYVSGQGSHFSAMALGASLDNFRTSSAVAMSASSSSRSSGGGFSGGGGGGGGGGSW